MVTWQLGNRRNANGLVKINGQQLPLAVPFEAIGRESEYMAHGNFHKFSSARKAVPKFPHFSSRSIWLM